jgi:cytochrome c oxidase subunit 2
MTNLFMPQVFHPTTPQAEAIVKLFYFDLIIAAVIFLTVTTLVITAIFRYRRRPGDPEPYQNPGNVKLETMWTVIPGLILLALLVATGRTMYIVNPPVGTRTPDASVLAHQWWWEYQYPRSGVITANEMHMVAGSNWLLEVKSADVIHNFWVPGLGSKMDAVPGMVNYLWIQPHQAGTYLGTCAEFCGEQHALMGIRVIVQSPEEFAQWEQSQLRVPGPPTSEAAIRGAKLFEQNTCVNCHRIAGTKANSRVGPDLTHLATRQTIASAIYENTRTNLTRWIQNPQEMKEDNHMPNTYLTEAQAQDIAVYLEELQ